MADMLATAADLNALPGVSVDEAAAAVLLETATGAVQSAAGQRLVAVADDTAELIGTTEAWLDLPQRPVTAVTSVTLDGEAITDWKRHGARLWRCDGWACNPYRPATVEVVYSHGYATNAQELQYARGIVLALAAQVAANPTGATGFSIDDYREQYAQIVAAMNANLPEQVRRSLRSTYGRRGGLVRLG